MIDYNGLIKKINLMTGSKDKALLINTVYTYLKYLMDSNQMTKEEAAKVLQHINEIDSFLKHYVQDENKGINAILESSYILNPMYKDILNYANKYRLFRINIPSVSINKLITYAKDFLYHIDPKLFSLLNYLIENDLVVMTSLDDANGKCFRLTSDKSGIIINYDNVDFGEVATVIHEMGHAYYNYLSKGNPNLVKSNIAIECIPRILEQLFLVFLKENNLLDNNTITQYERYFMMFQLNLTNSVYIINKLLMSGSIKGDFHIEKIKTLMSHEDFNNLGIIKQKDDSYQCFMDFIDNYYSYAFLLSMIVRENYIEDKDGTREFIKEIPYYSREYNAIEFIDMFHKTDYLNATKKNISRVLSKTNYKK